MSSLNQPAQGFVPLEAVGKKPPDPDAASRRRFLEVMGAAMAMAGAAGCTRQPAEFIMPYVDPPEKEIPGRPSYYATAVIVNGVANGVVAESHLGRPTKVEGNPSHPASLGATDVHGQACVLDLYDPDRAKEITQSGQARQWEEFLLELRRVMSPLRESGGAGLFILTGTVTSPSLGSQIQSILTALPNARWHQYEPTGPHSARAGAMLAFGRPVSACYRLDRAQVIVALDSNFLACGHGSTRYAHDFALGRRVRGSNTAMNRLYSIETEMTSTGGKADHRLPLRPSEFEDFTRQLAAAVTAGAQPSGPHASKISAISRDLLAHRNACVVIPGDTVSPQVHALAHRINESLGAPGNTVIYTDPIEVRQEDQIESLRALTAQMDAGVVKVLLMLGGNPVYDAPADFEFRSKLSNVPVSIHVSLHRNETSGLCTWVIPEAHFLEDWGDARAFDGTVTILQPLILPLYNGRSRLQVLDAIFNQTPRSAYDIVRSYWKVKSGADDFEKWWRESVRTGVVTGSALPGMKVAVNNSEPLHGTSPASVSPSSDNAIEVAFRPDPYLIDGTYANNPWLQELPRPITKLTWDNAVYLSPRTAKRLGVDNQELVDLSWRGRTITGSVWISPGQADNTAVVHLGYGRTEAGRVGNGAGFNAYPLRSSGALWTVADAQIRKAGGSHVLARTQTWQYMEKRDMVISASVDTYRRDPEFTVKKIETPEKDETLYPEWSYTGYAWGMSIDLTACVDCMACVIACQAENNIPVIGKEQILFNREMYWLRVDVYYEGSDETPSLRYQPVPCMHCENAPCELVCPVAATTHSDEGLNEMTYNRCVGTRYCSNNCPYKVRRFNFLLFNDWETEQLKMQRNPDVTVRSRGVMEKCTYCVQRIREAEIRATNENRHVRDGEIQTACQQVCPTRAIVFGDINNPANHVARLKNEKLNYGLLAELNTRPRTTYLAELRNPNPEMRESQQP